MARPKSQEKQEAILEATSLLIARYGLTGSPSSLIAKEAGVSEGTIFHYFTNKDNLLNQLYLFLKDRLSQELNQIQAKDKAFKDYLEQVWTAYLHWGIAHPHYNKTLNHLLNAEVLTLETKEEVKSVLDQLDIGLTTSERKQFGDENDFVEALFIALATTTIDFSLAHPEKEAVYRDQGFSLLWGMYEKQNKG